MTSADAIFTASRGHQQQSTVSGQIFAREVKTRASIDFCGLRRVLSAPLFDGLFRATLAPVYHTE
jgi:hypothetical protein